MTTRPASVARSFSLLCAVPTLAILTACADRTVHDGAPSASAAAGSAGSAGAPSGGANGGAGTSGARAGAGGVAGSSGAAGRSGQAGETGEAGESGQAGQSGQTAQAGQSGQAGVGGSASGASGAKGGNGFAAADTSVSPQRSTSQNAEITALQTKLVETETLTSASLLAAHAVPVVPLGFDPLKADNLALIQASPFAMAQDDLPRLGADGFVISEKQRFPTFTYGYASIYLADLPVFVSADSILTAVHKGYDKALLQLEQQSLRPKLLSLLANMQAALGKQGPSLPPDVARDLDLFLGVGRALCDDKPPTAATFADLETMKALYQKAQAHVGAEQLELFGVDRPIDFSQFEPRGHYADQYQLAAYFRAMVWFGRTDFRLIETQSNGSAVFRRRQLLTAVALRALLDEKDLALFQQIDDAIGAFVGEHDSMTLRGIDDLQQVLGANDLAAVDALDDATLTNAIVQGGFGAQRISSQIVLSEVPTKTLPLSSVFQLFGQRYTVDSHVFSSVVFDRVLPTPEHPTKRMLPNPLDAAFAAFGNDSAAVLLEPELTKYGYAPHLGSMRLLVDAHGDDYWSASLGTQWLSSLRALSPNHPANAVGLPTTMRTERWGRRVLNTQLASWAELRHDTLLYAKQSFTGGATCAFPDAYVDPYPETFARIAKLAARGQELGESLQQPSLTTYFANVQDVASKLAAMATKERAGEALSAGELAFINEAVVLQEGCDGVDHATGWYPRLFFTPGDDLDFDPTIADVHTQPTDENGIPVGKVLHVGTGSPRALWVTVDTCTGPRAYVGLASSYFERTTSDFSRLTDQAWSKEIAAKTPDDVAWMKPIVAR